MCDRQGLISVGLVPGGILGLKKEKDAGCHIGGTLGSLSAGGHVGAALTPGTSAGPEGGPFGVRVSISESLSWKGP